MLHRRSVYNFDSGTREEEVAPRRVARFAKKQKDRFRVLCARMKETRCLCVVRAKGRTRTRRREKERERRGCGEVRFTVHKRTRSRDSVGGGDQKMAATTQTNEQVRPFPWQQSQSDRSLAEQRTENTPDNIFDTGNI